MGTGHIRVIAAFPSWIYPVSHAGKMVNYPLQRPPSPPRSIQWDRRFPCHVIWSCGVNLRTRTSPRSQPLSSSTPSSPENTHAVRSLLVRSLLMPEQILLPTRVLNPAEDLQSVWADRTSNKVAIRRFNGENMLGLPQGNRNLKLYVEGYIQTCFCLH